MAKARRPREEDRGIPPKGWAVGWVIVEARTGQFLMLAPEPRGGVRYRWTSDHRLRESFPTEAHARSFVDDERVDNCAIRPFDTDARVRCL